MALLGVASASGQEPTQSPEPPGETGPREVEEAPVRPLGDTGRSESSSGQFLVYAPTLKLRGAFAVFAEEVKGEYLRLLSAPDDWGYPIVLRVKADRVGSGGAPVRTTLEEVEGAGFRFEVRAELTGEFSKDALREGLVGALMAEHVLRPYQGAPAGVGVIVPAWLQTGVVEAMGYRRRGRASEVFASIMDSGRLMELQDVFGGRPAEMDGLTEGKWRASCGALVLTLLEQPSGRARMQRMIARMAEGGGNPEFLLKKHFPRFRVSRNSVEKWWALQVATMAKPTVFELLDPAETEERLAEAVRIYYPEKELDPEALSTPRTEEDGESGVTLPVEATAANGWMTCDVREFEKVIGRKDVSLLVRRNRIELMGLEQRAFPLARPLVAEYRDLFVQIGQGKTKGLGEKLRLLEVRRRDLLDDAQAVADYLNWYEATQVEKRSGLFDRYLKKARELDRRERQRDDPISRALDEYEGLR